MNSISHPIRQITKRNNVHTFAEYESIDLKSNTESDVLVERKRSSTESKSSNNESSYLSDVMLSQPEARNIMDDDDDDDDPSEHNNGQSSNDTSRRTLRTLASATEFLSDMLDNLDIRDRATLSDALGSDSIRFNEMIRFLNKLGTSLVELSEEVRMDFIVPSSSTSSSRPVSSLTTTAKHIEERLRLALVYIPYFIQKFETLESYRKINYTKIVLGLLLIFGSIATMVFLAGGDLYAIALDVAAGGIGISFLGRGIKNLFDGIRAERDINHLMPQMKILTEKLKSIRREISDSQYHISILKPGLERGKPRADTVNALHRSGLTIIRKTGSCRLLPEKKDFLDWISRRSIKLSDLDKKDDS